MQCDPWVYNGKIGIVMKLQDVDAYCRGAWVILDTGLKLVRIDNLRALNEHW